MPKYLNSNAVDTMLGINRIPAGETFTTKEFFSTLPSGVTKVADVPFFNPILDSAVLSTTTTKTIPAGASSYGIRVYCQAGLVNITLSNVANTPVLYLVPGESWEMVMHNRLVDTVILTISGTSPVINYTVFTAGTCQFNV
jgi:hypothetical protein